MVWYPCFHLGVPLYFLMSYVDPSEADEILFLVEPFVLYSTHYFVILKWSVKYLFIAGIAEKTCQRRGFRSFGACNFWCG